MPSMSRVSKMEKKVVVVECDKVRGTYMELGYWDEDIGAERYAELLYEGRIREDYIEFDGNMLRMLGEPDIGIPLTNETVFRCYCGPGSGSCGACFMKKRTLFAEGRSALADIERREAKNQSTGLKRANAELKEENGKLETKLEALQSELQKANSLVESLKAHISAQYRGSLEGLPANDPLTKFHREADIFESRGGNSALKRQSTFAGSSRSAGHSSKGAGHPTTEERHHDTSSGESESGSVTERGHDSDDDSDGQSESSDDDNSAAGAGDGNQDDGNGDDEDHHDSGYNGGNMSGASNPEEHTNDTKASSESSDSDDDDFHPGVTGNRRRPSQPPKQAGPATTSSFARANPRKRKAESPQSDAGVAPPTKKGRHPSQLPKQAGPATATSSAPANPRKRKAESPQSDAGVAPPTKKGRAGTWSDFEKECLVDVMITHVSAVSEGTREEIHDVRLWTFVQGELSRLHGVDRAAQACRMTWNRGLRQETGIDERLNPDPARLATSLQARRAA